MEIKNNSLIIKDPIYKNILILSSDKKYLDLKEFQRLRYIKQLSFVDFIYPNANHTRFSHSLGAYHLMRKVVNNKLTKIDLKTKKNLRIAALLHDIGHGPFSHIWEKVFPNFNHEKATEEILKKYNLTQEIKIIKKEIDFSFLLSSTIDVDKMDYMARDSYFAGVSYGVSEVEYILENLYIEENKLCIIPKAIPSIEDLIIQRINLFKTVYFHKFALSYDFLFKSIFKRVKYLIEKNFNIFIDENLKAFFNEKNTIENLISLNDSSIIYHIQKWSDSNDEILNDLSNRFLERTKFNIINLKYNKININKIKKEVEKKYELEYYFSHIKIPIKIMENEIYSKINGKLEPLSKISSIINFYKNQKFEEEFLIFPRDIRIEEE